MQQSRNTSNMMLAENHHHARTTHNHHHHANSASHQHHRHNQRLDSRDLEVFTQSSGAISVKDKHFECKTDIGKCSWPCSMSGFMLNIDNIHVGLRPSQEDRVLMVPRLFHDDIGLCCVFDGTVGHHASEFLMTNMLDHLLRRPEMVEVLNKTQQTNSQPNSARLSVDSSDPATSSDRSMSNAMIYEDVALMIRDALHHAFLNVDASLIKMCTEHNLHYASSTGVTALLWKNLLTVAHVGDSKACIARVTPDGGIHPEWLTVDHKPNMPHELKRIQANGGSLAYLHGNKPYIRGGDFLRRQANGEHPKQLNYSRAFGGKDLKMFGLIAEPDINHFEVTSDDRLVLIASDGLWDVLSPKFACELALQAKRLERSPTEELVSRAIQEMPKCNVCDNITVIAIFLNEKP